MLPDISITIEELTEAELNELRGVESKERQDVGLFQSKAGGGKVRTVEQGWIWLVQVYASNQRLRALLVMFRSSDAHTRPRPTTLFYTHHHNSARGPPPPPPPLPPRMPMPPAPAPRGAKRSRAR